MDVRIHHVGLPLRRPEEVFRLQREALGMQHVCTFVIPGVSENYFSGNGCDVVIHLMGDPLYPYQADLVAAHGRTWEHINFLVDDVDAVFERLVSKGASPCMEPTTLAHVRYGSVRDPKIDVIYELMRFRDDDPLRLGEVDVSSDPRPGELRLGQVSLVVADLRETERRLRDFFGLRTVYDHTEGDGGFVLMADPHWDREVHDFVVKLWDGPHAGTRERTLFREKGQLIDSVVFYADDVETAYRSAVAGGARGVAPPHDDGVYGGTVAWIADSEGNPMAIVEPPTFGG